MSTTRGTFLITGRNIKSWICTNANNSTRIRGSSRKLNNYLKNCNLLLTAVKSDTYRTKMYHLSNIIIMTVRTFHKSHPTSHVRKPNIAFGNGEELHMFHFHFLCVVDHKELTVQIQEFWIKLNLNFFIVTRTKISVWQFFSDITSIKLFTKGKLQ